jgi:hypothetical protein
MKRLCLALFPAHKSDDCLVDAADDLNGLVLPARPENLSLCSVSEQGTKP